MEEYKFKFGDRVRHAFFQSYGIGTIEIAPTNTRTTYVAWDNQKTSGFHDSWNLISVSPIEELAFTKLKE